MNSIEVAGAFSKAAGWANANLARPAVDWVNSDPVQMAVGWVDTNLAKPAVDWAGSNPVQMAAGWVDTNLAQIAADCADAKPARVAVDWVDANLEVDWADSNTVQAVVDWLDTNLAKSAVDLAGSNPAQMAVDWVAANPGKAAAIGVGAVCIVAPMFVATPALEAVGFSASGVRYGSFAAEIQAGIGNVVSPSIFATVQSAQAAGYGIVPVSAAVQELGVLIWGSAGAMSLWENMRDTIDGGEATGEEQEKSDL
ncbi:hypothetical protein F5B18DRAFT_614620 [Nemania serpens]|nr:hypothetical protein F5B18DRAFT_614620 [Nemania serpens]